MSASAIDLDRLLKLRVAVARVGEGELAGWWNSKGQLGRMGARALARGFPRTLVNRGKRVHRIQIRETLSSESERLVLHHKAPPDA